MQRARQTVVSRARRWLGLCLLGAGVSVGCDAGTASSVFNPAFVDVVGGTAEEPIASVENAPGHVPIIFVNNLRFDSQLTSYLEALRADRRLIHLEDPAGSLSDIRPRIRMRIQVTFENGNTLPFEFVDGDSVVEIERLDDQNDPAAPAEEPIDPVLTQNDLSRMVAICNVARVEVVGDPQVFVPVTTRVIRIVTGDFGFQTRELERRDRPQFRPVLPDVVDENFNITLLRNFNVREAPAPAKNLTCGSIVGIVVDGIVSVPFTEPEDDPGDDFIAGQPLVPGYVTTDETAAASIPGRYRFTVTVR
ncbi:MAG TPA: hypothetical protein VM243_05610 [Phycisphaerae bacterium]|nr:hypothetical protein [Phycisphaerae bacterium]